MFIWSVIFVVVVVALLAVAIIHDADNDHPMLAPDQVKPEEQYRDIASFFQRQGWRQVGDKPLFTSEFENFSAELEIMSLGYNQLDTARYTILHNQAPPEEIRIQIPDARGFFHNPSNPLYAIMPNTLQGTFNHGGVQITGAIAPLFLQIYTLQNIARVSPCTSFEAESFQLHNYKVTLGIVFPALSKRKNESAQQLWRRSLSNLERGLLELLQFSEALAFREQSLKQMMEGVVNDMDASSELKHEASEMITRFSSPQELLERARNRLLLEEQRGFAVAKLVERDLHTPQTREVIALALDEDVVLRRLLSRYAPDFVEQQLRGPERLSWFNAIFEENTGLEATRLKQVIADLDTALLLDPGLSSRARNIILTHMLVHGSGDALEEVLRALLLNMDEEALVHLLQTLQSHPSRGSARALVALASHPQQIDKHQEFQVMLGAIKAHMSRFKEVLEHRGLEKFLCGCVLHEDRQVASMALSLLRDMGSHRSVDALVRAINQPGLTLPTPAIGSAIQAIRQRIGDTSDRFSGGLSLAEAAGGELSVIDAEAGALTDARHHN